MKQALVPALAGALLALGACSTNYAGEGALAGGAAGALIGAASGDTAEGAAIGAGVGAVAGTLIKKGGNCYRYDANGREYRVRCP